LAGGFDKGKFDLEGPVELVAYGAGQPDRFIVHIFTLH